MRLRPFLASLLPVAIAAALLGVPSAAHAGAPPIPEAWSAFCGGLHTAVFDVSPETGQIEEGQLDDSVSIRLFHPRHGRATIVRLSTTADAPAVKAGVVIQTEFRDERIRTLRLGKRNFIRHGGNATVSTVLVCLPQPAPVCTSREGTGHFRMVNGDLVDNKVYDASWQPLADGAVMAQGVPAGDVLHLIGPGNPAITVTPGIISVVTLDRNGRIATSFPTGFPFAVTGFSQYDEIVVTYPASVTVCAGG